MYINVFDDDCFRILALDLLLMINVPPDETFAISLSSKFWQKPVTFSQFSSQWSVFPSHSSSNSVVDSQKRQNDIVCRRVSLENVFFLSSSQKSRICREKKGIFCYPILFFCSFFSFSI